MTTSTRTGPPGLPAELAVPSVDVAGVLRGAAATYGDRVAYTQDGRSLTYAELGEQAARVANGLAARGITAGDVVAVHLPNCLDYPGIYYGVLSLGAIFSPTNPLLPPADLAAQLVDSGARVVVTWGPAAQAVQAVRGAVPAELVVTVDAELPDALTLAQLTEGQPTTTAVPELDPATALAHVAYTGGTTGRSKGVELTHTMVLTNVLQSAAWNAGVVVELDDAGRLVPTQLGSPEEFPTRLGEGSTVNLTPWFHAMGVIGYLNVPVLTGMSTIIHPRFEPGAFLADLEACRATMIGGAPPVFVALMRHPEFATRDLSTVRSINSGAAPLPVTVLDVLRERFPDATVCEGYGLTEVTMAATLNPAWRSGDRRAGTVGLPIAGCEVRLVDEDFADVTAGERGEVAIRGPQVMRGYRGRPDATAEVLRDGWLRTGDIGTLDDDGYLAIVDRAKDMILYKGYNVFPRELEELLFTHPDVGNAAVVGRPDDAAGELPVAFVALAPGASATAEELMAHVNAQVVPYKKLREVRLVEAIPVSAAGKILRRELRDGLLG